MPEPRPFHGLGLAGTLRVRASPFWDGVLEGGVKAASVYNHMYLPCEFESVDKDYRHLKRHVQLWDVGCQRQVEIAGPDAARLLEMIVPRRIAETPVGRCRYVPVVDWRGRLLNDPVLIRLAEDRFWLSIADSDLALYALGVAAGAGLDVAVFEPDVSPLGIQGPKAAQLVERAFGTEPCRLRFFGFCFVEFAGKRHVISRTGWSKQGGFEIYVDGHGRGRPIWNALMEAGEDLEARAGCPNYIERIEGGLLSYGGDVTREHSPYEAGLEAYCDAEAATGCLGRDALLREQESGPKRQIRSLSISGGSVPICDRPWPATCNGRHAGQITAAAWSPDYDTNVAIGMIESDYWDAGAELEIALPGETRAAAVQPGTFN